MLMAKYEEYKRIFSPQRFTDYSSINDDEYLYRRKRAFSSSDLPFIKYDILSDTYKAFAEDEKGVVHSVGEYYDIIEALLSHDSRCAENNKFIIEGKQHKKSNRSLNRFHKEFINTYKDLLSYRDISDILAVPTSSVRNIVAADNKEYFDILAKTAQIIVWDVRSNYKSMVDELANITSISDAFVDDFVGV